MPLQDDKVPHPGSGSHNGSKTKDWVTQGVKWSFLTVGYAVKLTGRFSFCFKI